MMNKLVIRSLAFRHLLAKKPTMLPMAARLFNASALGQVVNNFYARGESEEVTIASVSKTMGEIIKTHIFPIIYSHRLDTAQYNILGYFNT